MYLPSSIHCRKSQIPWHPIAALPFQGNLEISLILGWTSSTDIGKLQNARVSFHSTNACKPIFISSQQKDLHVFSKHWHVLWFQLTAFALLWFMILLLLDFSHNVCMYIVILRIISSLHSSKERAFPSFSLWNSIHVFPTNQSITPNVDPHFGSKMTLS